MANRTVFSSSQPASLTSSLSLYLSVYMYVYLAPHLSSCPSPPPSVVRVYVVLAPIARFPSSLVFVLRVIGLHPIISYNTQD